MTTLAASINTATAVRVFAPTHRVAHRRAGQVVALASRPGTPANLGVARTHGPLGAVKSHTDVGSRGARVLARAENDEVQQDCARALCNLSSNEENHLVVYRQGGLVTLVELTNSSEDVCQRYAAMGLRFLASNPEVRVFIVKEGLVAPFLALPK